MAGRQISVFRCAKEVTRTLVNTDAGGRAAIPIRGGGVFLLNAVDIWPVDNDRVLWASDLASLTFPPGTTEPACPL